MDTSELRKQSVQELKNALEAHRQKVQEIRFQLASGKEASLKDMRERKKTIAQILTILKEKNYV